jgi:HK97 family phage prohead protease
MRKEGIMPKFKSADFAAQMGADGVVEGYAATFDREPDSYGDVIAKGAFARTLDEWRAKEGDGLSIPLLYGHNTDDPMHNIGKVTEAYEDEKGLFVHAEFDADNPTAQYARKLAAEGRLYQFSFAYAIRGAGMTTLDDGVDAYELRDLDLYEVSLVQIPANQHAVVTSVKGGVAEVKSGRRNSKADEDELRHVLELATQITTTVRALLGDEPDEDEEPEPKPEEPAEANGEEAKDADVLRKLRDVANQLLANE